MQYTRLLPRMLQNFCITIERSFPKRRLMRSDALQHQEWILGLYLARNWCGRGCDTMSRNSDREL